MQDKDSIVLPYDGVGRTLVNKARYEVKMIGENHCYFHAISCHLMRNQHHHFMVRQQLCDFIEAKEHFENLKVFIQPHTTGKDYIQKSGMPGNAWAPKVELMATALKCGKEVICYLNNKWS